MLPRALWARDRLARQQDALIHPEDQEKGYGTVAREEVGDESNVASSHPFPNHNWMSAIDDKTLLSAMTLPGTHDSAAFTYSWPFVQTQSMNILQQLHAGIRYLDLRCGLRNDVVEMVHGPSFLGITLRTLLDIIYIWLNAHETEGLVVQIKQDRKAERSEVHFGQAIWLCLAENPDRWRTANTTPVLGELRGKIQLLRRFDGSASFAYGIDVSQWQDNPSKPFTIYTRHQVRITIQDHYSFPDPESLPSLITKKGHDVAELLDRASADPDSCHWFINFVSAYEFNLYYQLTPREIALGGWVRFRWAHGMNIRLRNYLHEQRGRQQRFGIVAMDFPNGGAKDLITTLVRSNFSSAKQNNFSSSAAWTATALLLTLCFIAIAIWAWLSTRTLP